MIKEGVDIMDNYVITISRQFGSLGRPIAKKMSELLGIGYYDRYILGKTASKLETSSEEIVDLEETAPARLSNMRFPFRAGHTEMQDSIFEVEQKIIFDLAQRESCIIVGRCSDYILRNLKNHISIFIYAPYYERLKNCIDTLDMQPDEAKRIIDETDKAREQFNIHYAGCSATDITMKEIMIDSSLLGIEGTAELLVDAVKRKFQIN